MLTIEVLEALIGHILNFFFPHCPGSSLLLSGLSLSAVSEQGLLLIAEHSFNSCGV